MSKGVKAAKDLYLPNFKEQFTLCTDASEEAIGGMLTQYKEGKEVAIAWISRPLSPAEKNYTVTEKECLAVVWRVDKLKMDLHNKFIWYSDNSALKWLLTRKEPTGRLARWIMKLQEWQYEIRHIRGTENIMADALSRGVLKIPKARF